MVAIRPRRKRTALRRNAAAFSVTGSIVTHALQNFPDRNRNAPQNFAASVSWALMYTLKINSMMEK